MPSYTDELQRHTNRLWLGIWLATVLILVGALVARRLAGYSIAPLSLALEAAGNGLVIANFCLMRTRYARLAQGIYVFVFHMFVPVVMIFYGGTHGFGDIALYMGILLGLLYGWKRWMLFTYGLMGVTLGWVLYQENTGHPFQPINSYAAQFPTLKFAIMAGLLLLSIHHITTFYKSLLGLYQQFAEDQVQLNSDLKASEQALEQVNRHLILSRQSIATVREEERRRLCRDLHDGLGPMLAAQVFRVGVAQQLVDANPPKAAALLSDVESGIRDTLANVRQLVYGLRPPMLDQLGLLDALADVAKQQEERVAVRLALPAELPQVSAAIEVALFRILQTALDNITKHAHATCCDVHLRVDAQSLILTIADDGIGIDHLRMSGVGLTSMQERAEELGGTFHIQSTQPHGTWLQVSVPLLGETAV